MRSGYHMLIVGGETIVALDLCEAVRKAEEGVVGPCSGTREARAILKGDTCIDAAVLDVNVSDGAVTSVLDVLRARRIPTLIYTGEQVPEDVRRRHPDLTVLSKPVWTTRLIDDLRRVSRKLVAS